MIGHPILLETKRAATKGKPTLREIESTSDADTTLTAALRPEVAKFVALPMPRTGVLVSKIFLALIFAGALCQPSLAQSPDSTLPPALAPKNEILRESQPSEQSGQSQQMMKEARSELERSALTLQASPTTLDAQAAAREALVEFDQSLDQLHQSIPGFVPLELATSLHEQVAKTLSLVDANAPAAATSMLELALRVTDLTAEADLLIGRSLIGLGGAALGTISNVLIAEDGRIEAIVIDRIAPRENQQFVVSWKDVSISGTDFLSEMTPAEADRLPDYAPA